MTAYKNEFYQNAFVDAMEEIREMSRSEGKKINHKNTVFQKYN